MKKRIFQTIILLLAFASYLTGLISFLFKGNALDLVKYFTLFSGTFLALICFVALIYNIVRLIKKDDKDSKILFALKLIASVATGITFLTVVCYLQWQGNFMSNDILVNITLHYVGPILFLISFLFFDIDTKRKFTYAFIGPILVIIYGLYTVIGSSIWNMWNDDVYGFTNFANHPTLQNVIVSLVFVFGSLTFSFLLWLINRINYLIFTGEEIEENDLNKEEIDDTVEVTKEDEELLENEIKETTDKGYIGPRIYHISKRKEDEMWQVKFANGKKAIKLFSTQKEAIIFANKLALTNKGSIRVHSLKGRIRKA